jgi:hypothetical protein
MSRRRYMSRGRLPWWTVAPLRSRQLSHLSHPMRHVSHPTKGVAHARKTNDGKSLEAKLAVNAGRPLSHLSHLSHLSRPMRHVRHPEKTRGASDCMGLALH